MKNRIILVLLAVAIFIPSAVAIVSYNKMKSAPVSEKNIRTMELADLAGNTYTFTRGKDGDDNMIDFFLKMNASSQKISSLPDPLVGTSFFKVDMQSMQQTAEFQYYFSTNAAEAYYVNGSGEAFSIPEKYAAEFIAGKYAVSLYVNAVVPKLLVAGSDGTLPASATWKYKNSAGVYTDCETTLAAGTQELSVEGSLDLGFTLQPDHFSVKLTDAASGDVLFNDIYDKIDTLAIDRSVRLNVEIDAKWYEDASRDYYGEMKYAFTADVAAAAEFTLGETTIENGRFTVVSARNISDVSRIQFTSSPDIGFTPVFYKDGDYAIALIPIRCELEAGDYTLTFKYGGVSEDLTLKVTQRNVRNFDYSISAAILNATRTDKTIADFKTAVSEAAKSGVGQQLWEGTFSEAVVKRGAYDGIITTGFGHNRKIAANGVTYIHEGVDYLVVANAEVYAVNNGNVVFAGYTELGGNTVVIEHGYGLKSWYCHLSQLNVSVGDSVKKGDVIGLAGTTGFTTAQPNYASVHAGMSVFDVAVSPYPMWEKEILIVKK